MPIVRLNSFHPTRYGQMKLFLNVSLFYWNWHHFDLHSQLPALLVFCIFTIKLEKVRIMEIQHWSVDILVDVLIENKTVSFYYNMNFRMNFSVSNQQGGYFLSNVETWRCLADVDQIFCFQKFKVTQAPLYSKKMIWFWMFFFYVCRERGRISSGLINYSFQ